ncbi:1-deoxy-D-xylulose-5-phosphate synthase [Streptomyces sp. MUM 178J]|uniref:1-deoxy-D-xylulose-5-phosphate synthase n=1 Tax=Streptomyces sp. MUM 178J TaxID=2791991 RepID=UPI001F04B035|nr:1-deoxy-D-xylulose-5-phosphate synthase [Streptomyces sp. MUM 178J]WRQ80774.1 1-deoxy-D-xylulose-5-phosphate synthase [Streptomyces sp. MUM 178J]
MTTIETVQGPENLRGLTPSQLRALTRDIRRLLVDEVTRTGGHLGPCLGVVELTIALHRVFESPKDRIMWDTGHQTYVHKMLTGRAGDFKSLRQPGGLSGYPSRAESEHDVIENSHASTVVSYADGLAKAYALQGVDDRAVVAVIGDGALTGGMAWEGLNNLAAAPDRPVVVVLNDNTRSYAPTVGGIAAHLAALRSGEHRGPSMFENMGLSYVGPVDGHDLAALEETLRHASGLGGPVVVHCLTEKGRGHEPAEQDEADRFHAVRPRPAAPELPQAGALPAAPASPVVPAGPVWTDVFSTELAELGTRRQDLVAITAAMLAPTGLTEFAERFPDRTFDVGIAEQHAVTSAAGLALGGWHPVVALYATFLNRAFDQMLLDVALHRAPVTFVLDRAGVTGDDGASHNGMWDLSLFQLVPGLRVAAPRDAATLRRALGEAVAVQDGPTALRFPKGTTGPDIPAVDTLAGMDVLRRAGSRSRDVLLVSVGPMAGICLEAADRLAEHGFGVTVVDPRWITPVPTALVELGMQHDLVATVEDNGLAGGSGAAIARALADAGARTPTRTFGVPQRFLDHGRREDILVASGLTGRNIARVVVEALAGREDTVRIEELAAREPVGADR